MSKNSKNGEKSVVNGEFMSNKDINALIDSYKGIGGGKGGKIEVEVGGKKFSSKSECIKFLSESGLSDGGVWKLMKDSGIDIRRQMVSNVLRGK